MSRDADPFVGRCARCSKPKRLFRSVLAPASASAPRAIQSTVALGTVFKPLSIGREVCSILLDGTIGPADGRAMGEDRAAAAKADEKRGTAPEASSAKG